MDIAQTLRTAAANQTRWPQVDPAEFVRLAFGSKPRMCTWLFFWQTLFVAPFVLLFTPLTLLGLRFLSAPNTLPLYAIAAIGIIAAVLAGLAGRLAIRPFVHRFHRRAFAKRTIPALLAMGRCAAWLASNLGSPVPAAAAPPPSP